MFKHPILYRDCRVCLCHRPPYMTDGAQMTAAVSSRHLSMSRNISESLALRDNSCPTQSLGIYFPALDRRMLIQASGMPLYLTPPGKLSSNLSVFKELVLKAYSRLHLFFKVQQKEIHESIKSLCNRKDFIILPADKGGGIVELRRQDYQEKMSKLLADRETCSILKKRTHKYV